MNVRELIDKLNTYPPDTPVWVEAGGDGAVHEGTAQSVYELPFDRGITISAEVEE